MRPGEIHWAEIGGAPRPVIVVSREELNRGNYVTIVPLTSSRLEHRRELPNCVPIKRGSFGIEKDCVAQADQLAVIESSLLVSGCIGTLDFPTHQSLIHAIAYVLTATCELA